MSSEISTNSNTNISRNVAGLYEPDAPSSVVVAGAGRALSCATVAAASSRRPEDAADPGLNVGMFLRGSDPEVASVPAEQSTRAWVKCKCIGRRPEHGRSGSKYLT